MIWDNITYGTYLDARVTQSGSDKIMTECVRIFLMSFDHEFVRHPREVSHFVTLKWARALPGSRQIHAGATRRIPAAAAAAADVRIC